MTSPVFHLPQITAEFLGYLAHHSNADRNDGLRLAVSVDGLSGEGQANDVVFVNLKLCDQIDVKGGSPFIENEDWRARGSTLPDDGHHSTSRRSI
jgi:hypothetical protein